MTEQGDNEQVETLEQVNETEGQVEAEVKEDEETEVQEEESTEVPGKPKLYSQGDFDDKLSKEYGEWQSKTLRPITQERDILRAENKKLKVEVSAKHFAKDNELLFEDDNEVNSEADATKRKEARARFGEQLKEYREKAGEVAEGAEKLKSVDALCEQLGCPDIAELGSQLGAIQKNQDATKFALELLLPKDKAFISRLESIVKRFEDAKTPAEAKLIQKAIEAESKGKAFVPAGLSKDSAQVRDLSGLSPTQKIELGLKEEAKKKK